MIHLFLREGWVMAASTVVIQRDAGHEHDATCYKVLCGHFGLRAGRSMAASAVVTQRDDDTSVAQNVISFYAAISACEKGG